MKFRSPPTPTIGVCNLQRKVRVNVVELETFARKAATLCSRLSRQKKTCLEKLVEISVLLVSDRRMAALHRRYLNQPGPTDVITFQHGEIVISVDSAAQNARGLGNSLGRELRLYIVHGLLHLHGFDDRDETSTRKMRLAEKRILAAALE